MEECWEYINTARAVISFLFLIDLIGKIVPNNNTELYMWLQGKGNGWQHCWIEAEGQH